LAKLHYDGSKVAVGNISNALQYQGDTRSLIENAKGGAGNDAITGGDPDIARAMRDTRLGPIGGGTDEVMKEILAKQLGL
jgi:alkylation response protein AidB-like acyl-CoA dehydrogenase